MTISARQSVPALDETLDKSEAANRQLTSETLKVFLKWATRIHPSDVELTTQNLTDGVALAELLVSFSNDHFGDLLDRLCVENKENHSGVIRKVELIREQLRSFYADKSKRPIDEATSFLAPASEIVSHDEDSLMRLMIVIYGVAASLNHISNKDFNELLQSSTAEIQEYTNEMVKEFASQLKGSGRANIAKENNVLKSKLKELKMEVSDLKDEKVKLELELSTKEIELTKYAGISALSQEVEMKSERLNQTQDQLRVAEDHCTKLEIRVTQLTTRENSLFKELTKTRERLKSTEGELREVRDNKAALEHQLSISTARTNEVEQTLTRLQQTTSQKPSERDHAALKDRYGKILERNSELEQQCQSLESYKMLLESHKAQLEQANTEKEVVLNDLYTEQQQSRELKMRLKEMESRNLTSQPETSGAVTPTSLHDELSKTSSFDFGDINEEMVKLKVEVSSLQSEKQGLQEEVTRTRTHVENEKERSGALLAQVRLESEQLALKHKTLQNEFMRQKHELDGLSGKCKKTEDEKSSKFATETPSSISCFKLCFLVLLPLLLLFVRFILCVYVYDQPFNLLGTYSRMFR